MADVSAGLVGTERELGLYQELFDFAPGAYLVTDTRGIVRAANRAAGEMLGAPNRALPGMDLGSFVAERDRALFAHVLARLCSEDAAEECDLGLSVRDLIVTVRASGRTVEGSGRRLQWLLQDISRRSEIERALRESEQRFRDLAENINEVFWISSPDQRQMLYVNPCYEEIWGQTRQSLYECPGSWMDSIVREDRERMQAVVAGTRVEPLPHLAFEYRIVRPDGSVRWIAEHTFPIRNQQGEVYLIACIAADVSERKQAEKTLEDFFVASPAGLMLMDDQLRFVRVNPMMAQMNGYSVEAHIGRPLDELVPDLAPVLVPFCRRILDTGEPALNIEFSGETASQPGVLRHWVSSYFPVRDAGGVARHIGGVAVEVTDLKRAQEQERERSTQLQLAVEASNTGLWDWDLHTNEVYHSAEWKRQIGYAPDELVDELDTWMSRIHSEDAPCVQQSIARFLASGRPHNEVEFRLRHKDGSYRWILSRSSVLYDEAGKPCRVLGSHQDITERKQAEEALQQSEARYRELFDDAPIPMLEEDFSAAKERLAQLGAAGVEDVRAYLAEHSAVQSELVSLVSILDINNAAVKLYEAEHKEQLFGSLAQVVTVQSANAMCEELVAVAAGTTHFSIEVENATLKGGIRQLLLHWAVLPGHEKDLSRVLVSMTDITDVKHLEEQFRQAQKMEAVGRLAGGVAHDFNNLLTAIQGYAQFVQAVLPKGSSEHEDIGEVLKAADRAVSLTRQLLAFSRRQVLEMRVLDLNGVLAGMGKMLERIIGENIAVDMDLAHGLWSVRADAGQIEQVLLNLAVNARDAMPTGGTLTISTANVLLDEAFGRDHLGARVGPHVLIAVSDTGHGMSPAVQAHLFEPFFTTKGVGTGTGLGLATVYGIIQQSGGSIYAESQPGSGSTFRIYLPREGEGAAQFAGDGAEPLPRGGETILLVEDDPHVRAVTLRKLRALGYQVLEAPCAAEALRIVRANEHPIHLVLTDVVMPGANGRELAESLRDVRPGLKTMYMSGYTDDSIVHLGVLDGSTPFLQKPFTTEDLARKVRQSLDERRGGE
jgi:two-component system, cell cycle sensor histidine kinase and response regulator CckA